MKNKAIECALNRHSIVVRNHRVLSHGKHVWQPLFDWHGMNKD